MLAVKIAASERGWCIDADAIGHVGLGSLADITCTYQRVRFRYVETDGCDRFHDWLLRIVGALTAPHILGTRVPVREPSTASKQTYLTSSLLFGAAMAERNSERTGLLS
jgi:hypothetical protein